MLRLACVLYLSACLEPSTQLCASGVTCGFDALCDDIHGGCIVQDQLDACQGLDNGTSCATGITGPGACDQGVCLGQRCGDGYRATEEMCDGTALGTLTNCTQLGFYDDVALTCSSDCQIVTAGCTGFCGDGTINGREQCDGAAPSTDCIGFGFGTGIIDCVAATCAADLTRCIPFGWRAIAMPAAVRAIGGTSATNVWVTGDGGMVRRFDGTTWTAIDVSACVLGSLTAVVPLSATDAFLLDDSNIDGVIRVTATGCTRSTIGTTDRLHAIWADSLTNAYAAEDDSFTGVWHFDGTSWSPSNGTRARFIWGTGPNNIYTGSIFRSDLQHYTNGTWSSVTVPGIASVWGIWGTGSDDFYVGAMDASDHAVVKRFRTGIGWTTELADLPILGNTAISMIGDGSAHGNRTAAVGFSSTNQPYVLGYDGTGWANLGADLGELGGRTYMTPSGDLYLAPLGQPRIFVFEGTTQLAQTPLLDPVKVYAVGANTALAMVRTPGNTTQSLAAWNGATWTLEADATANVSGVLVDEQGNVFVSSLTTTGLRQRTGPNTYVGLVDMKGIRVGGTSPTDLWVITFSPTGTITHWDGSNSRVDNAMITDADFVLALTPTLAFAFGANGTMSRFTSTGWSAITSPLTMRALGFSRTSSTEAYVWSDTELAHFANDTWTLVVPPPGGLRGVWGTSTSLFAASGSGVHYFDGVQWMRVDSVLDVRSIDGRGDSIYYSTFGTVQQLYRTRPW